MQLADVPGRAGESLVVLASYKVFDNRRDLRSSISFEDGKEYEGKNSVSAYHFKELPPSRRLNQVLSTPISTSVQFILSSARCGPEAFLLLDAHSV